MTPKLNPNTVVRRQVEGVEFGLYTDEEVRDRSVVEVRSPLAYDSLGTPLPSGLYDPVMGPSNASDPNCVTCGLNYMDCPGHSGHVELAVPVYHPLLFTRMVSLMKTKCLACHGLRLDSRRCRLYEAKLHLLDCGRVTEATELEEELGRAIRASAASVGKGDRHPHARLSSGKPTPEDAARAASAADDLLSRKLAAPLPRPRRVETSHERSVRRSLLKEVQSAMSSARKCSSCGAISPKVRHDAFNKVFWGELSESSSRSNMAEGIEIGSALAVDDPEDEGDEEGKEEGGRGRRDKYDSEDSVAAGGDRGEEDRRQLFSASEDEEEEEDVAKYGRKRREATVSLASAAAAAPPPGAEASAAAAKSNDKYMHPLEVEAQIKLTWLLRPKLCSALFGSCPSPAEGYRMFFLRAIPVPPPRFRPPMIMGTMTMEHAQNYYLNGMLGKNERVRELFAMVRDDDDGSSSAPSSSRGDDEGGKRKLTKSEKDQAQAKLISEWIDLQTTVNCYFDSSKDPSSAATENVPNGIRQLLEKKEGIFRKHMMGKRVDHACRSVISPDPCIGTNEIGIPLPFARALTYPTPVSRHNVEEMRNLVKRGPDRYPGAVWAETTDGRRVNLGRMSEAKREAVAARIGVPGRDGRTCRVGRQLRNGDMMLVNRQPTLHKPGIMAHYVRILHNPTQKTIRMHYANCNTYNADYDGDEMNCHFPQSDLALAEAKHIAATDLQYIVPTDGSPLRGLIQDHVDAGVKLTAKNTFLERWECMQLLFAALSSLEGLEVMRSDEDVKLCPPAIRKPRELWTGKQIVTMLLRHLAKGTSSSSLSSSSSSDEPAPLPGVSVERKAKTPPTAFGPSLDEHLTIVRDGELLRGVLDKAAFGSTDFSLVHGVYEAYGPEKAGLLLNSLGRLFTAYLQYYSGHSCRMEDLVLTEEADEERRELVQRVYNAGSRAAKAWADSEGGKVEIEIPTTDAPLTPFERASAAAKIGRLLSGREGPENFANLDGYMQGKLNPLASQMIKACLPNGLAVPFPENTFGLMVTTGAKGSTVNQSQVSCALGQQALEGRRVPRLASGRTLPSFAPYDPNPRADGFIADRFLTGVRPQEYYFHCMAGREGLVDTAVKTSRSGYLQRCLVKHLEELKVSYDGTVRDGEGGVVQFLYGEDGIDPTKAAHLDGEIGTFEYMARNHDALSRRHVALPNSSLDIATKDALRAKALTEGSEANLLKGSFVKARKLRRGNEWVRGALCRGWYDAVITKRHSHGKSFDITYLRDKKKCSHVPLEADLGRCGGRLTAAASSLCTLIRPSLPDPILSDTTRENAPHRIGSSGACVSERVALSTSDAVEHPRVRTAMESANIAPGQLQNLIAAKYASALCEPGEAVGSIAAQSVGEPSTQMTLNTFHLAGCGGANVTLGIPRLREVIMTASKELKTPTMSVPLHPSVTEREATRLTRYFMKLTLMEVIASSGGITVTESLQQGGGGNWERAYFVKLKLHPAERIREAFELSIEDIAKVVSKKFIPKLAEVMKKELKRSATEGDVGSVSVVGGYATDYVEGGASNELEGDGKRGKKKKRASDDDEYEDDVAGEEDGVMGSRFSHRKELASYGDMDDEEKEIASKLKQEDDEIVGDKEDEEDEDTAAVVTDDEGSYGWDETSALTGNTVKIDKKKDTLILHPLRVDPSAPPLLMVGIVEIAASATLVKSRPKIDEAYINTESENDRGRCLQTAGVNFAEIWNLKNVDHSRLISNDTWAVRYAYGVEAARSNIVEQIRSVFAVYGISVDPRHLSLIADYMTYDGGYKALNRIGMADVGSSFLQMSFETTATFLTEAALRKRKEPLMSPSASIVLGRPIRHGTGAFELFTK